MRQQQIQKIHMQQKHCRDMEKEAESKKKVYLTVSKERMEIKDVLGRMEQAYLDAQAGVLAARSSGGDAVSCMWFCPSSETYADSTGSSDRGRIEAAERNGRSSGEGGV